MNAFHWLAPRMAKVLAASLLIWAVGGQPAGGTPAPTALGVKTNPNGTVALFDGARLMATVGLKTMPVDRGMPVVRRLTVQARDVVVLTVPTKQHDRQEVWIGHSLRDASDRISGLWTGFTGAQDADGETHLHLRIDDQGIARFQTSTLAMRCDGAPARLFPEAWDWERHQFVPVAPDFPAVAGPALLARPSGAVAPVNRSGFAFTVASDSHQAGGNARALTAPSELDDDDPTTWWLGSGGTGARGFGLDGFFFTARAPITGYGITDLRIDFTPAAGPPDGAALHRRPTRLVIATGSRDQDLYAVDLTAVTGPSATIALPAPVHTACVTVFVVETAGPRAAPVALAGLRIQGELDGEAAVLRLADDLARGPGCQDRLRILARMPADDMTEALIDRLAAPAGDAGRTCVLMGLAQLLDAAAAPTLPPSLQTRLATALVSILTDVHESNQIWSTSSLPANTYTLQKLFAHAGPSIVRHLQSRLMDERQSITLRILAARSLATINDAGAHTALIAAVGMPDPLRHPVRRAVGQLAAPVADIVQALRATAQENHARREDLLQLLTRFAPRVPEQSGQVVATAIEQLQGRQPFLIVARAIAVLGAVGGSVAGDALSRIAVHADDEALRFLAVVALSDVVRPNADADSARAALRHALRDRDPRVRAAAVQAAARHQDHATTTLLLTSARRDPWPFARRAAVLALAELCPGTQAHELFQNILAQGDPELKRVALRGVAQCRIPNALAILVDTYASGREMDAVRESAADAIGTLPPASIDPQNLDRMIQAVRAAATRTEQDVNAASLAGAGLRALAQIKSQATVPVAVALARAGHPVVQRMALETLGVLCDPGAGASALVAATGNADPWIATTARAAMERCAARR